MKVRGDEVLKEAKYETYRLSAVIAFARERQGSNSIRCYKA